MARFSTSSNCLQNLREDSGVVVNLLSPLKVERTACFNCIWEVGLILNTVK